MGFIIFEPIIGKFINRCGGLPSCWTGSRIGALVGRPYGQVMISDD